MVDTSVFLFVVSVFGSIGPHFIGAVTEDLLPRPSTNSCKDASTCIDLRDCAPLVEIGKTGRHPNLSALKFIKSKMCAFENGTVKVCCPNSQYSHPDMGILQKKRILQHKALTSRPSGMRDPVTNAECSPPFECVDLPQCSGMIYLSKMERPMNPVVAKFLRSQMCGLSNGVPKVCCAGRILPSTTPVPKPDFKRNHPPTSPSVEPPKAITRRRKAVSTRVPSQTKIQTMNAAFAQFFDYSDFDYFDLLRKKRDFGNSMIDLGLEIR